MDHAWWAEKRFTILEKLIIMNQCREKSDDSVAWDTYKKVFFFWFMIDRNGKIIAFISLVFYTRIITHSVYNLNFIASSRFYGELIKKKELSKVEQETYSEKLGYYIRTHESDIIKRNEDLIQTLQNEVYPCESLNEFRDVAGIMGDIDDDFIKNTLEKHLTQS